MTTPILSAAGLGFSVARVSIPQGHGRLAVAEKPRHHRQRRSLHHSMGGERMAKIVEAHILDADLFTDCMP